MGKFFTKGLDEEEDKKEGSLKRLKNIEELLKITKNKTKSIKEITSFSEEPFSPKAKVLIEKTRIIQKDADYKKLKTTGGNNITYNFSDFKTFNDLYKDLISKKMLIDDAEKKQDDFDAKLNDLNEYSPRNKKYIEAKNTLLDNAKNVCKGKEKIIEDLKKGIFLLKSDDEFKKQQTSKKFHENKFPRKPTKINVNKSNELIIGEETDIDK